MATITLSPASQVYVGTDGTSPPGLWSTTLSNAGAWQLLGEVTSDGIELTPATRPTTR